MSERALATLRELIDAVERRLHHPDSYGAVAELSAALAVAKELLLEEGGGAADEKHKHGR